MSINNTHTPILGNNYYHIYNRGNNHERIFFNNSNYDYFLSLYKKYLNGYCSTLSYCLIPNHFHLLIKTNDSIIVKKNSETQLTRDIEVIGKLVSEQFRRLFISYSQAIKKQESIDGNLFCRPFKRLLIDHEEYVRYLTFYIHYNPEKHDISNDFRNYRYSSFKALIGQSKTNLDRLLLLDFFGGKEGFIEYHNYYHEEKEYFTDDIP